MAQLLKHILLFTLLGFGLKLNAQNEQYAFLVHFKDKALTEHNLNAPQTYLSTRAIERRSKYNIAIDSTDLPVVPAYVDSILHITNGFLHLTSKWDNYVIILIPDSTDILLLNNIAFVKDFKQVAYYATGLHYMPSPNTDTSQTGNKPTDFDATYYGAAWNQIHLCHGEYLHNEGYRGNGKLIAVIDAGFMNVDGIGAFDSLFQQGRLIDHHNYVLDTDYVYDYSEHGTNVLSCMASVSPEIHVGTAPDASYALYISEDVASEQLIEESNFAAAAERADSIGADEITTSLGYNTFDNPADNHTYSDLDGNTTIAAKAANMATRKGIFVVASAGNEGATPWGYILTPGDADSAMTIGSVNSAKVRANSSSHGPNAAGHLKPDECGMGVSAGVVGADGQTNNASGTSFAAPVIAGLSACLMQAVPNLTPMQLKALIASISDSFSNPDSLIGNGVPDFRKAINSTTAINGTPGKTTAFFSYFPNPANKFFYIKGKGTIHFNIMDMQGRQLIAGTTTSNKAINISQLSKGIYLLQINDGNTFQTSKLMIE